MTDIRARVTWKVPGRPNQLIAFQLRPNIVKTLEWREYSCKPGEFEKLPTVDIPEPTMYNSYSKMSTLQRRLTRQHITSLLSQSALSPEQISFLTAALLRGDIR